MRMPLPCWSYWWSITIMAILASLLLPVISQSKRQTQSIVCQNNLKQIGMSYRMAADENPAAWMSDSGVGDWAIEEVGRPENGWICPSAPLRVAGGDPQKAAQVDTSTLRKALDEAKLRSVDSAWLHLEWENFAHKINGVRPKKKLGPRAGSYALNGHLGLLLWKRGAAGKMGVKRRFFAMESEIKHPSKTPILSDRVYHMAFPLDISHPPRNLLVGDPFQRYEGTERGSVVLGNGMSVIGVPRHGDRPEPVPTDWPAHRPLPGAINIPFYYGHVETVKLGLLWNLRWHRGYTPPEKVPGRYF